MKKGSEERERMVRYLLGELPEDEQSRVEDRAFEDREYRERLLSVENDLIDEYARGELLNGERARFERLFLASAGRRQRVNFARALKDVIGSESAALSRGGQRTAGSTIHTSLLNALAAITHNAALKYSLAAAALAIACIGAFRLASDEGRRAEVATTDGAAPAVPQAIAPPQPTAAPYQSPTPVFNQNGRRGSDKSNRAGASTPRTTGIASFTLLPAARSSEPATLITIPRDARRVSLWLPLEEGDDFQHFRAELLDARGAGVWTSGSLAPRRARVGRGVTLLIPARLLKPGEYELTLKGATPTGLLTDVNFYHFGVRVREP